MSLHVGVHKALALGVVPFLIGDAVKNCSRGRLAPGHTARDQGPGAFPDPQHPFCCARAAGPLPGGACR